MNSPLSPSEKLPAPVRRILLGVTLSALGNGLVLPFAFIYLHSIRGISTSMAGLVFSFGAIVALSVAPFIGSLIDKWGPKPILLASLLISAIGYSSLALVRNVWQAILVMVIAAIGQSGMWPSQSALNTELTPEHLREKIYGSQFALLNLGLGLGGMFSALIVSIEKPSTFELLYLADGTSFLIYFFVVLSLRGAGKRSKSEREVHSEIEEGWKEVIQDRTFVKVWLVAFFAIFLSYSQLEVGFTAFGTLIGGIAPSKLAWAYAVNTVTIALFQMWVIKKLAKVARGKALTAAILFWALAWAILAIAGISKEFAVPALILCQFVFALGEMIWSPIMPAIVNQLAPDHLRGRYNSASANAWQVGMIMGPASAGILLGAGLWPLWIALLVGALLLVAFFAARLNLPPRRVLLDIDKV